IEDNEREDVRLVQRRCARELQLWGFRTARHMHLAHDSGVGDLPRCADIEHRVQLRLAGEANRAIALQLELPSLKLIGAADGIDDAPERDGTTSLLADVEVAADGNVHVTDGRARRTS